MIDTTIRFPGPKVVSHLLAVAAMLFGLPAISNAQTHIPDGSYTVSTTQGPNSGSKANLEIETVKTGIWPFQTSVRLYVTTDDDGNVIDTGVITSYVGGCLFTSSEGGGAGGITPDNPPDEYGLHNTQTGDGGVINPK